jgi:cytochrome c peroxidase
MSHLNRLGAPADIVILVSFYQAPGVCRMIRSALQLQHVHAARRWLAVMFAGLLAWALSACGDADQPVTAAPQPEQLDAALSATLVQHQFTGTVEQQLETRLGRKLDPKLFGLGGQLFFDRVASLHNDNACAGCHTPADGYGDSQSISIGVQNNLLVGPNRLGPRNLRRAPSISNTAFYPALMWDGRFSAPSGDPFNNVLGYLFPHPEGSARFRPNDPFVTHLLVAQAFMPSTELAEMAGFTGIREGLDPRYLQFDDGQGDTCPALDAGGSRNDPIRARMVARLNAAPAYVKKFGAAFPEVANGAPIDMVMFARAIAEFEYFQRAADAPIDRFARGETGAMTDPEKRGALLFFGRANCVACHAVAGQASEMFSDFRAHNIGVPQIAPVFGVGTGNMLFDGPGEDEDYGLARTTGVLADRYRFRTSPLRNVGLQPAFFHNGAFTRLDDAVRHHLNVIGSLYGYNATRAGVAPDLRHRLAPAGNVAASVDPLLRKPMRLDSQEEADLVQFLRTGLLDVRAQASEICKHVPATLPSGAAPLKFEGCPQVSP